MKVDITYKISGRTLTIALVGMIILCSSCLMYFYDPLQLIINKLLALSPGTIFFNLWAEPPYDVVMKLYIFNVTNPNEFLKGEEKIKVQEIGPYAYKEILTNTNTKFNEDGTLTYSPRRDFHVDMENSIGNVLTDRIISPNIPLLGIQSFLQDASFITNLGYSTVTATLGAQPFLNLTVDEFLWGYDDKLVTIANQFLPNWIDFGKFGLLERLMNRDNTNTVKISVDPLKRKSDYDHLLTEEEQMSEFHIVEWNGFPGLQEWGYQKNDKLNNKATKKCELIEGSFDGTIFPRNIRKNRTITLFRKAFCRPVPLEFIEVSKTKQGFRSYNYKMKDDMFAEGNPDNECFCFKGECPSKGLQTIAPCYYGIPIVLSLPHFLNVDPEITNKLIGLNPDPEKHDPIAKIQPDLGVPLDESSMKIQVNLGVGQTKYNAKTRPFNNLTIPLFWIELTCSELPPLVAFLVTLVVDVLPAAQNIMVYLLGLIGLAMISGAALLALFSKGSPHRSLSISSEYSPLPVIRIPSQYFKSESRTCK